MADSFALSYRLLQERLAEVEAERDRLYTENQEWRTVANGQAARLAAVEALHALRNNWGPGDDFCANCRYDWPCPTIRAARGEGDRA